MQPEQAFGVVLRDLRQGRGLSQEALAQESDLDRTFISLLERGLRQPSLRTMLQLAGPLGVQPERLVRDVVATLAQGGEAMRILEHHDILNADLFERSDALREAWDDVREAIAQTDWPHGAGTFTIYPESGKKRGEGNGVKLIKVPCIRVLRERGWQVELAGCRLQRAADRRRTGSCQARCSRLQRAADRRERRERGVQVLGHVSLCNLRGLARDPRWQLHKLE
jgi:transcriptional regulator with XRE-family HTH domain